MSSLTRAVLNASKSIIKSRFPSAQEFRTARVAHDVVFAVCYSNGYRKRAKTKLEQIRADAKKAEAIRLAKGLAPLLQHSQPEQKISAPPKKTPETLPLPPPQPPPPPAKEAKAEEETAPEDPQVLTTFTQAVPVEETEEADRREQSWQRMKFTFSAFGITFTLIVMVLILELGRPKRDQDGEVIADDYSHLPVIQQYFYRLLRELDYYRKLISEPSREKLLPDVLQYPYHQPPYTVVLELKDVLVHPDWSYSTGWRFKKRPGIDQFLENLNGIYEIVIYTAELGMTVFPVLEALDPKNLITYKLVRDATNFVNGHYVKDLDKLNRDLNKVVLVDWDSDASQYYRDNVLQIPRWNGNDDDTTLLDLANFLQVIAISEIQDVRDVLRYYKEFPDPLATFKERQRELERTMHANQAQ